MEAWADSKLSFYDHLDSEWEYDPLPDVIRIKKSSKLATLVALMGIPLLKRLK